jgi:hypothetical protein
MMAGDGRTGSHTLLFNPGRDLSRSPVLVDEQTKKPAGSPAFPFRYRTCYLRFRAPFFAEALRAAFFLARVRAPLRAEALRAALLPRRGAELFLAAAFLPRFLAAAIFVSPR